MSRYFLLITLLFLLSSCEDPRQETFHANGKVKSTVPLVNEKKQGIEVTFYSNGKMQSEVTYSNGLKEGPATEYYEDSTIQAKYTHVANFIEGEVTRFHPNGQLAFQGTYSKNKLIAFPKEFDEKGKPLSKGTYVDPRDDYEYEWVRIDSSIWTAQNINFATEQGSLCMQCASWGRLYDFEAIQKACPKGFHIPSEAEWNSLLKFAGKDPGPKLKATFGWDPIGSTGNIKNGTNELGFQIKAGGAHYAAANVPLKERKFDDAGKRAFFWTAEGNVVVFFHEKDNYQIQKWNPIHGASLRCIKDTP